jgi:hypothetical protein
MTNASGPSPTPDQDTEQAGLPDMPAGKRANIGDLLGMPGIEDIEFEIPPRRDLGRAADLS